MRPSFAAPFSARPVSLGWISWLRPPSKAWQPIEGPRTRASHPARWRHVAASAEERPRPRAGARRDATFGGPGRSEPERSFSGRAASPRVITSVRNEEIVQVAKLGSAKERKAQGAFAVEGVRAVGSLLEAGMPLRRVYAVEGPGEEALAQLPLPRGADLVLVSEPVMKKLSSAVTPQGVLALFETPPAPPFTESDPAAPAIALVDLQDPGNVGTVVRTAAAFAVRSVLLAGGVADPFSPKCAQASAGTLACVRFYRGELEELFALGRPTVALVVRGGEPPAAVRAALAASAGKAGPVLLVGNEGRGLPAGAAERCALRLTLPMPEAGVESLNAATAASLALYALFSPHP
eukprot:tig00000507_g1785.t1